MTAREIEIHTARVCLREAAIRRASGNSRMADTLLQWAANARKRAASAAPCQKAGAPATTIAGLPLFDVAGFQ